VEQASGLLVAGDSGPGAGLTQTGLRSKPELADRRSAPPLVQFESSLQRSIDDENFSKNRLYTKTLNTRLVFEEGIEELFRGRKGFQ
jgi:hypothetical protein